MFKLTENDKQHLLSKGYLPQDFPQIEKAASVTSFTLCEDGKERKIGISKAEELLGRPVLISGLGRSAFHSSATRETKEGAVVFFDSGRLFR